MAYQLIYTSHPKSLVMGRTGFSTVARTRNMPEKLAAIVERCGVYDIEKGEVFSHRIVQYSGGNWHILTRMKDAGVDYTNRNNYIAHHIILSEEETIGLANPAEILAQWNGWLSEWKKDPAFIDEPAGLKKIKSVNSLPAKTWEKRFGNPSKAALLHKENVYILAGLNEARTLLNLFSESCLLNSSQAWENTFTTSFSRAENPSNFMWKAMSKCENATINLSANYAPPAPDSRAAQYAASGELTEVERLNLKIKSPIATTRFKVVEHDEQKPNYVLYALSTIVSILVITIAIFAISGNSTPSPAPSQSVQKELPILQTDTIPENNNALEKSVPAKASLLDTMNAAREKIEKDEYSEAIKLWDNSEYALSNPSLRKDLLSDIGSRVDHLLRTAENELALDGSDEIAIKNLMKVREALEIEGVKSKERRLKKWKTLNDKIKK